MVTPTTLGSRAFHPIVVVVAALGVLVFALVLVSQAVFHSSVDPTEQSFAVTLHNDTPGVVTVEQCDTTCDAFHERDRLPPGAGVAVNTSSDDVANWWAVDDATGRTVGCLPLRYDHKIDGLVVNALFLLVAGVAVASIVFATVTAHRWVSGRGLQGGAAATVTSLAALVAVLGGWLVFDFYVAGREGARFVRRRIAAT